MTTLLSGGDAQTEAGIERLAAFLSRVSAASERPVADRETIRAT